MSPRGKGKGMKRFRVTVATYEYLTTDIEAGTKEEAERLASDEIWKNEGFIESRCDSYDSGAYVIEGEAFEIGGEA